MNKNEALQKIEELKKFIEEIDSQKVTIEQIVPGACFKTQYNKGVVLMEDCTGRFICGGLDGNTYRIFVDQPRNTVDMLSHLNKISAKFVRVLLN